MEVGTLIDTPVQWPAPNAYWGRKFGVTCTKPTSMCNYAGERMFVLKKYAANYNGNSNSKPRHYTRILAINAMAKGWLNGERLKKEGT